MVPYRLCVQSLRPMVVMMPVLVACSVLTICYRASSPSSCVWWRLVPFKKGEDATRASALVDATAHHHGYRRR